MKLLRTPLVGRTVYIFTLAVGILLEGCARPVPHDMGSSPDSKFPAFAAPSAGIERGPWDAERLRAAETLLNAPARSDLDKQRQALASAYLYWGDALFKGLGLPASPEKISPTTGQAPLAASGEEENSIGTGTGPPAALSSPPLWYWTDRQQQDLDRILHEQREQYYRNRQQAPQFQRPPICNSTQVGGQVYTHCY